MREMTIVQAAASFGVSVDTVRRRIKLGMLDAHTDQTGRRMVVMQGTATPPALIHSEAERLHQELEHTRALLDEVRRQRDELAAQLDAQRQQLLAATRALERDAEERAELRRLLGTVLEAAGLSADPVA